MCHFVHLCVLTLQNRQAFHLYKCIFALVSACARKNLSENPQTPTIVVLLTRHFNTNFLSSWGFFKE
eukprot:m.270030 g.270030  ORF g.270030 m.270030 type:complete len:67 (-) comp19309_c0_seq4:71-271(-)